MMMLSQEKQQRDHDNDKSEDNVDDTKSSQEVRTWLISESEWVRLCDTWPRCHRGPSHVM